MAEPSGNLHRDTAAPTNPLRHSPFTTSSATSFLSQSLAIQNVNQQSGTLRTLARLESVARWPLFRCVTTINMASTYSFRKVAAPNTLAHRVYVEKDGVPISFFHDIPLYATVEQKALNMIVEIPRWTNSKFEV